jgi:paraquat-inducible protein B
LDIGSSVFYRHITAGQVVGYSLDPGGTGVSVKVFINAPFDGYVSAATRFWQASGIDMSLSSDGVKLRTESLTSILEGGVAFGALPGALTTRVPVDSAFTLYEDQDRAMRPFEIEIRPFVMYFGGGLRGLSAGAPVDLNGITVGEVKSVDVEYDQSSGTLDFPVMVDLYPQRLRGRKQLEHAATARNTGEAGSRVLIDSLVSHGLRAELKTGNLLTGQKYVSLDMHRDAPKDRVDWKDQPAIFPTISSGLDDIQDSVGVIAKKLSKVPFDRLSARLMNAMDSLDRTLKDADQLLHNVDSNLAPQVQATLNEAQAALKNAKDLLGQDAPLENDLGSTLLQVSRAAKSISALVDYLERHPESLLRGKPPGAQ